MEQGMKNVEVEFLFTQNTWFKWYIPHTSEIHTLLFDIYIKIYAHK